MVEAYVKGTTGVDDTLDTIAVEVEEALTTDITRGGNAKDTKVTAFEASYCRRRRPASRRWAFYG